LVEKAEQMFRDNQRIERELEALLSEKPVELNVRLTPSQQKTIP
jgi:predicted outer membrane protein